MRSKVRKWDKLSKEELYAIYTHPVDIAMFDIITFLQRPDFTEMDINVAIDRIVRVLADSGNAVPCTNFRPHLKPYWNANLSRLKSIKVEKFRIWQVPVSLEETSIMNG